MYRIFIVEDDAAIAGVIRRHLEGWGYTVRCAERFDDVLSEFAAFDPHLVLLDVSLPFFNGYHWCQEIRRVSQVPILFLTSASDSVVFPASTWAKIPTTSFFMSPLHLLY